MKERMSMGVEEGVEIISERYWGRERERVRERKKEIKIIDNSYICNVKYFQ